MKYLVLFTLLLWSYQTMPMFLINSVSDIEWPFKICSDSQQILEVQHIQLREQPKKGSKNGITIVIFLIFLIFLTFVQSGVAKYDVFMKRVQLKVILSGREFYSEMIDFVKDFEIGETFIFKYDVFVPSFAPSVHYSCFRETTQFNSTCLKPAEKSDVYRSISNFD